MSLKRRIRDSPIDTYNSCRKKRHMSKNNHFKQHRNSNSLNRTNSYIRSLEKSIYYLRNINKYRNIAEWKTALQRNNLQKILKRIKRYRDNSLRKQRIDSHTRKLCLRKAQRKSLKALAQTLKFAIRKGMLEKHGHTFVLARPYRSAFDLQINGHSTKVTSPYSQNKKVSNKSVSLSSISDNISQSASYYLTSNKKPNLKTRSVSSLDASLKSSTGITSSNHSLSEYRQMKFPKNTSPYRKCPKRRPYPPRVISCSSASTEDKDEVNSCSEKGWYNMMKKRQMSAKIQKIKRGRHLRRLKRKQRNQKKFNPRKLKNYLNHKKFKRSILNISSTGSLISEQNNNHRKIPWRHKRNKFTYKTMHNMTRKYKYLHGRNKPKKRKFNSESKYSTTNSFEMKELLPRKRKKTKFKVQSESRSPSKVQRHQNKIDINKLIRTKEKKTKKNRSFSKKSGYRSKFRSKLSEIPDRIFKSRSNSRNQRTSSKKISNRLHNKYSERKSLDKDRSIKIIKPVSTIYSKSNSPDRLLNYMKSKSIEKLRRYKSKSKSKEVISKIPSTTRFRSERSISRKKNDKSCSRSRKKNRSVSQKKQSSQSKNSIFSNKSLELKIKSQPKKNSVSKNSIASKNDSLNNSVRLRKSLNSKNHIKENFPDSKGIENRLSRSRSKNSLGIRMCLCSEQSIRSINDIAYKRRKSLKRNRLKNSINSKSRSRSNSSQKYKRQKCSSNRQKGGRRKKSSSSISISYRRSKYRSPSRKRFREKSNHSNFRRRSKKYSSSKRFSFHRKKNTIHKEKNRKRINHSKSNNCTSCERLLNKITRKRYKYF